MSFEGILKEIKELSGFVEFERVLKNRSRAEREFAEMLERNVEPYYDAYYSDYLGDDISEMRIVIIDENGNEHECPQRVSERYANRHMEPYDEDGVGITDFMIELIGKGIIPKEFRIINRTREEINRDRVYKDYEEVVGNITIEHLGIVKQYLLKRLQQ